MLLVWSDSNNYLNILFINQEILQVLLDVYCTMYRVLYSKVGWFSKWFEEDLC